MGQSESDQTSRVAEIEMFQDIVCGLVRGDISAAEKHIAAPRFDHKAFWELMREGRLRSLAGVLLDSDKIVASAPPKFIERLTKYRDEHARRQTDLRRSLGNIQDRFCRDKIDFVAMKGFIFGDRFYPNPTMRQQYDLDILVHKCDIPRSVSSLRAMGYKMKGNRKAIGAQKLRTEHAVALNGAHAKIDLHWRLRGFPACQIEEHMPFETAVHAEFDGRRVMTLSDEYTLTLLMLSIAADLGGGVCRMKHWLDLLLAANSLNPRIDWDGFFQRREREGLLSMCVNVLALLPYLFPREQGLFWVDAAISQHRRLVSVDDADRARELAYAPRGSVSNVFWLLGAYPSIGWREVLWFLDRNLPHPGRLPLASFRSARFAWRATLWQLDSVLRRRKLSH